jgi:hypothetical protein
METTATAVAPMTNPALDDHMPAPSAGPSVSNERMRIVAMDTTPWPARALGVARVATRESYKIMRCDTINRMCVHIETH